MVYSLWLHNFRASGELIQVGFEAAVNTFYSVPVQVYARLSNFISELKPEETYRPWFLLHVKMFIILSATSKIITAANVQVQANANLAQLMPPTVTIRP